MEYLDCAGRYLHVMKCKGRKQCTPILPKAVLVTLYAHFEAGTTDTSSMTEITWPVLQS
ncbi:MAG: hypothetical protein M0Q13_07960 [Methanothrix sp.]|nr:hypothetical protein [Methanothrix sp.]